MKKYMLLLAAAALSGCSMWQNFSFDDLNPWAAETLPAEAQQKTKIAVNPYLWQAALDKLTFMGIKYQNAQNGQIMTEWKTYGTERFKVIAEVKGTEMRADALHVNVYKEIKGKSGWFKAVPGDGFRAEVENAIIKQAKVLYRNDNR